MSDLNMSDIIIVILTISFFYWYVSKDYRFKKRKQEEYRREYEQRLREQEEYRINYEKILKEQQEEQKRKEEQRKIEEIKRQEELKKQDEFKRQEEIKIQEYLEIWEKELPDLVMLKLFSTYKYELENEDEFRIRISAFIRTTIRETIDSYNNRITYYKYIDKQKFISLEEVQKEFEHEKSSIVYEALQFARLLRHEIQEQKKTTYNVRCTGICSECKRDICVYDKLC